MENWTGTMQINRVDGEPLLKSGEWQYDPWWNCWYLNGESFPRRFAGRCCDGIYIHGRPQKRGRIRTRRTDVPCMRQCEMRLFLQKAW